MTTPALSSAITRAELPHLARGETWKSLHKELVDEINASDVIRPSAGFYARRALMVFTLYAGGYALLLSAPETLAARLLALIVVAFATVQGCFITHDAGHGAVVSDLRTRSLIGHVLMTFMGGQSFSRWVHMHNLHHAHPNHEDLDPDMQVKLFALYPRDATQKRGLARALTRVQHLALWPLLLLQAFSIKLDTLRYAAADRGRDAWDRPALAGHYLLWLGVPALVVGPGAALVNYILLTMLFGPYISSIFLVNHVGARRVAPGTKLPFLYEQVATARNLPSGPLITFVCGGLNCQIEHHLVPRASMANIRRIRGVVAPFCARHGIPYEVYSWRAAIRGVYTHLQAVSRHIVEGEPGEPAPATPSSEASTLP
jgi:fatty acid desaturase